MSSGERAGHAQCGRALPLSPWSQQDPRPGSCGLPTLSRTLHLNQALKDEFAKEARWQQGHLRKWGKSKQKHRV